MNTKDSLKKELSTLGLKPGDLVMMHASMRAIGKTLGGPDQVHQAIMDVILPNGTLMMYVGCEPEFEAVGRGRITQDEEKLLLEKCPAFDPYVARARKDYGIMAEFFRSWPGVKCSGNPGARIAAFGKKANWLISKHPLNYGYGHESPLEKLHENAGKLLLLGSDLDQITLFHYAEHILPTKNKRIKKFKVPLLENGKRVWVDIEEYDTSIGIYEWPHRFFETIMKKYIQEFNVQQGNVGQAKSYLLNAKSLVDFAVIIFLEELKKRTVI